MASNWELCYLVSATGEVQQGWQSCLMARGRGVGLIPSLPTPEWA